MLPKNLVEIEKVIKMKKIRVLIAKAGLDGHDRGAMVLVYMLRDAGMEVIFTGIHQTPEQIVQSALEEDVDVLGLSSMSGAHNTLFPKILNLLKEKGLGDVLFIGGGIIPEKDAREIKELGVAEIFRPGTTSDQIINFIRNKIRK